MEQEYRKVPQSKDAPLGNEGRGLKRMQENRLACVYANSQSVKNESHA